MKIRAASRFFGVPKTTLIDRLFERVPEKLRHPGPQPLLGIEGETKIGDWVINISKCSFPITKDMLLETVSKIDKDSGLNLFFGEKTWTNLVCQLPYKKLRGRVKASTKLGR